MAKVRYAPGIEAEITRDTLFISVAVGVISGLLTDYFVSPLIEGSFSKFRIISK